MTDDEEREEIAAKLSAVGDSIVSRESGDRRDIATVGCIMTLCFAIREKREIELAEIVLGHFTELEKEQVLDLTDGKSH